MRIHVSLRVLRILNQKPKENKETKSFVNTSTSTLRTSLNNILILIKNTRTNVRNASDLISNTKISCRFHGENFTLLEEMSSLTDTQNENEDTDCRRDGHSAHSAHLGMRWVPVAQMEEGSCVSVGLTLIS